MQWVTVIWTMVATVSATLAVVHGLFWVRQRDRADSLFFTLMALGTSVMAGFELLMMRAGTVEGFGGLLRWYQVAVWLCFVGLVGFVWNQLGGRLWLAWFAVGLRTISLIFNFGFAININYLEIRSLVQIPFLWDTVALAEGVPNPWMLLAQLSLVLLLVFVVDATARAWGRGERQRAISIGGTHIVFVLLAMVQAVLVFWGFFRVPLMASLFFMGIVGWMGLQLSMELVRAKRLAEQLQVKEADLRTSEERLNLAAEAAGAGLWSLDHASGKLWSTAKVAELLGLPPGGEIDLDRFLRLVHPEDRERVGEIVRNSLSDGSEISAEYRSVVGDGQTRWFSSRGRVRSNGDGRGPQLMGATVDITERKTSEDELSRQRAELAHMSRVASLSELSTSLAHELNQPLAIILSNAQAAQRLLAQDPPDVAEVREILMDIVSEDRRAGDIIRRLRAMLKRGETQRIALGLNEAVNEVLQLLRNDLLNRGVVVKREFAEDLPRVLGDRIPIEQVVLNLLMNACDATATNPPEERVVRVITRQEGREVRCAVVDRGCGLPADPESVFKPFYTTKPNGLGMGLSICRTIISTHGGRLWAQANAERGATFCFTLPLPEVGI